MFTLSEACVILTAASSHCRDGNSSRSVVQRHTRDEKRINASQDVKRKSREETGTTVRMVVTMGTFFTFEHSQDDDALRASPADPGLGW